MANRTSQRGFTLVELIVTISILTVLAGILIPSVNGYIEKGHKGKATADMRHMASVFNQYKVDNRVWPSNDGATTVKTGKHDLLGYPCFFTQTTQVNGASWEGPYVSAGVMSEGVMVLSTYADGVGEGFLDPWGQPYRVYTFADGYKGTKGGIFLVSAGADGKYSTGNDDLFSAKASADDLVQLVTYSVL